MKHELIASVVGVQFSDYKKATSPFFAGQSVTLTHDKNNKFDPNAVTVECNGVRIGFLARNSVEQQLVVKDLVDEEVSLATYNPLVEPAKMFTVKFILDIV